MNLKSQDVLIVLKILCLGESRTYSDLAEETLMSASEGHAAVRRAVAAGLMDPDTRLPLKTALGEFLLHGFKYVFSPTRGAMTRGIPTAHAAPPLSRLISQGDDLPPVWPFADGKVRGYSFSPLCRSAPMAALRDPRLYEWLALLDAIRGGKARERALAEVEIKTRLGL